MLIKYYEINGCNTVKVNGSNPDDIRYVIYAPDGTPFEVLRRYGFSAGSDRGTTYNYKYLTNAEIAEMFANMAPDKTWSIVGNGKLVSENDRQLAKKLCWVSTAMLAAPTIAFMLTAMLYGVANTATDGGEVFEIMASVLSLITSACPLVGIITLIIAKFKDPNSKFAKILIVVYTVLAALSILTAILTAIACGMGMYACLGELQNCS